MDPLSQGLTSIGAVLHARTVREFSGTPDELFAEMIQRCHKVRDHLGAAERTTPVYRTANFAYTNAPVVGDHAFLLP